MKVPRRPTCDSATQSFRNCSDSTLLTATISALSKIVPSPQITRAWKIFKITRKMKFKNTFNNSKRLTQ